MEDYASVVEAAAMAIPPDNLVGGQSLLDHQQHVEGGAVLAPKKVRGKARYWLSMSEFFCLPKTKAVHCRMPSFIKDDVEILVRAQVDATALELGIVKVSENDTRVIFTCPGKCSNGKACDVNVRFIKTEDKVFDVEYTGGLAVHLSLTEDCGILADGVVKATGMTKAQKDYIQMAQGAGNHTAKQIRNFMNAERVKDPLVPANPAQKQIENYIFYQKRGKKAAGLEWMKTKAPSFEDLEQMCKDHGPGSVDPEDPASFDTYFVLKYNIDLDDAEGQRRLTTPLPLLTARHPPSLPL